MECGFEGEGLFSKSLLLKNKKLIELLMLILCPLSIRERNIHVIIIEKVLCKTFLLKILFISEYEIIITNLKGGIIFATKKMY